MSGVLLRCRSECEAEAVAALVAAARAYQVAVHTRHGLGEAIMQLRAAADRLPALFTAPPPAPTLESLLAASVDATRRKKLVEPCPVCEQPWGTGLRCAECAAERRRQETRR